MLSNFHILTVSHQETSLESLPGFGMEYSDEQDFRQQLIEKQATYQLEEIYYLSTCNRVLYLIVTEQEVDTKFIEKFFEGPTEVIRHFQGEDAILYLFQVASSVHSMVVGEREIITQIRTAYEQQVKWPTTGDNIRLIIQQTIRAAKRVYAETKIGEKPISVVSLAVKRLLDLNLPRTAAIILVGAGQTNKLVVTHLVKKGFKNISVYNRTIARAQELTRHTDGIAGSLKDLPRHPQSFDCLIACTGAQQPTISFQVANKLAANKLQEKILVDLGLPGDLDPQLQENYPEQIVNLQSLKELSKTNLSFRKGEVLKADKILRDVLQSFKQLIYRRRIERAFGQIPIQIKDIKERAIGEIFRGDLAEMDDHSKEVVIKMMDYMERRCISVPMKAARDAVL